MAAGRKKRQAADSMIYERRMREKRNGNTGQTWRLSGLLFNKTCISMDKIGSFLSKS